MKRFSTARFAIPLVAFGLSGGAGCALEAGVDEAIAQVQDALGFGGWERVQSKTFSYAPAIVARTFSGGSKRLDVVAAVGDGTVYYNTRLTTSSSWQGWSAVPNGVIESKPAITTFPIGSNPKLIVAGRASDGAIWVNAQGGSSDAFGSWFKVEPPSGAGSFVGAPAIVYRNQSLYIFARKSNKRIYFASSVSPTGGFINSWDGWHEITSGSLESEPAAVVLSQGNIAVVARGGDNRFYINSGGPGSWTGWSPIGNTVFTSSSAPGVAFRGSDVDVFGRRSDEHIWQSTFSILNPSGATFTQIPEPVAGSPGAFATDANRVDVVARGLTTKIYLNTGTP